MEEEKKELTAQEMENVSGGYIYDTGDEDEEKRWVVIDLKGNVYKVCKGKVHAMEVSKHDGFGTRIITTEELQRLRETGSLD